jgi:hypothetical protein
MDPVFCFTKDDLKTALLANGWSVGWGGENFPSGDWVPPGGNPDHSSMPFRKAVEWLMYNKNLTPKNVDRFWK